MQKNNPAPAPGAPARASTGGRAVQGCRRAGARPLALSRSRPFPPLAHALHSSLPGHRAPARGAEGSDPAPGRRRPTPHTLPGVDLPNVRETGLAVAAAASWALMDAACSPRPPSSGGPGLSGGGRKCALWVARGPAPAPRPPARAFRPPARLRLAPPALHARAGCASLARPRPRHPTAPFGRPRLRLRPPAPPARASPSVSLPVDWID